MKILFVTATTKEAQLFRDFGGKDIYREQSITVGEHQYQLVVTGAGIPATVYGLLEALNREEVDLVINTGIAGSFQKEIPAGEVVCIKRDAFGDLGVEILASFRTPQEMKWEDSASYPFEGHWLKPGEVSVLQPLTSGLREVTGLTVNKVTDQLSVNQQRRTAFNAQVETMEGAAVFYTCMKSGVPVLALRSISNLVGQRDRNAWKTDEALDALSEVIARIPDNLNPDV